MSPWLFNLFIVWVVKEINARVLERGSVMQIVLGLGGRGESWKASHSLFADSTALVEDWSEKLLKLMT